MRSVIDWWSWSVAKDRPGRANEDYSECFPNPQEQTPDWADFAAVVADGVGSSDAPADAAAVTARNWLLHTRAKFLENGAACAKFGELHFNEITSHAFLQCHEAVIQQSRGSACAVAACIQGSMLMVGNVGDCRAYRISGSKIEQLSRDQVDSQGDPTDVLGGRRTPQAHASASTRVQAGDIIVLCTDGVWKLMAADEMRKLAVGASAREVGLRMQKLLQSRRGPDSDDATLVVAMVKQVGAPFWEADGRPMETRPRDDAMEAKLNGVLAELLNRLKAPMDKESQRMEQLLDQLNAVAREVRAASHEMEEAAAGMAAGIRRTGGRRQTGPTVNSTVMGIIVVAMLLSGAFGWIMGRGGKPSKVYELKPVLPKEARVVSQSFTDNQLQIKYTDADGKLMMAVYNVEDGGRPHALIDLTTQAAPKPVDEPDKTQSTTQTKDSPR